MEVEILPYFTSSKLDKITNLSRRMIVLMELLIVYGLIIYIHTSNINSLNLGL